MYNLKPTSDIRAEKIRIDHVPVLVLHSKNSHATVPGILWIHGGGYFLGMKEMVYMGRSVDLVRKYGAVVVSPGYRLAIQKPYPAAISDCYKVLKFMNSHADDLGFRKDQIMVGGESAGGGLAAALCMLARDKERKGDKNAVKIAYQMPLYPMLSNIDTESSKDNHGRVWNTRRNHLGWSLYLRSKAKKKVSPYASPAWQTDYRNLPTCYTFVGDGEPFYRETLDYVENLKKAGVEADVDVYHTDMHAFDMMQPEEKMSRKAAAVFEKHFEYAMEHYFA